MANDEEHHRNNRSLGDTPAGLKLAGLLAQAAGPGRRYAVLDDGATVVAAGRWDAIESWAAAQKLAVIRELIRRYPAAGCEPQDGGALPAAWQRDLCEEVACELGISKQAADALINLAWVLQTRLPLTAAALDAGILNISKARLISDETRVLSEADAGAAEALVAGWWAHKTWSQIHKKITLAVVQIDPDGARKRREAAEREEARVRFWREHAGTAGLAGYGLPADEALKAMQHIQARARAYKRHGIAFPLDQLRALAMLDMILQRDSRTRYPKAAPAGTGQDGTAGRTGPGGAASGRGDVAGDAGAPGDADAGQDCQCDAGAQDDAGGWQNSQDDAGAQDDDRDAGNAGNGEDGLDDDADDGEGLDGDDADDEPDGGGPGNGDGPAGPAGPAGPGADDGGLAANVDLVIPALSLLGLAERPGEAHGLGVIDADLARRLAAAAARDPRSRFGIIVTDQAGRAIGYGQATRTRKPEAEPPPEPGQPTQTGPPGVPGGTTTATLTQARPGPPGGYGTWQLGIGELELTVKILAIPGGDCDHQHQSAGYQPSDTLRRLVQIRDGECTLPVCVRHPRSCEWEHTVPWPAGPTCSCNGAMRCRHDHRVKEAWTVQQLPGGWHKWTAPSGRTYTKGPREYPT